MLYLGKMERTWSVIHNMSKKTIGKSAIYAIRTIIKQTVKKIHKLYLVYYQDSINIKRCERTRRGRNLTEAKWENRSGRCHISSWYQKFTMGFSDDFPFQFSLISIFNFGCGGYLSTHNWHYRVYVLETASRGRKDNNNFLACSLWTKTTWVLLCRVAEVSNMILLVLPGWEKIPTLTSEACPLSLEIWAI